MAVSFTGFSPEGLTMRKWVGVSCRFSVVYDRLFALRCADYAGGDFVNLVKNATFSCDLPLKNVIFMEDGMMCMIFLAIFAMFFQ